MEFNESDRICDAFFSLHFSFIRIEAFQAHFYSYFLARNQLKDLWRCTTKKTEYLNNNNWSDKYTNFDQIEKFCLDSLFRLFFVSFPKFDVNDTILYWKADQPDYYERWPAHGMETKQISIQSYTLVSIESCLGQMPLMPVAMTYQYLIPVHL